ncbi:MAG TPA: helix-turn-helix transcriptional regulator [Burkholderiaceae bacterium]|nr:helix-turn-helix transcriptional regulator [Burkholderiaceae bacterium]
MTGPGPDGGPQRDATGGGVALRSLRTARRISQARLAQRCNCDHSYVSRVESGDRTPTRDAVGAFARAMRLDGMERDQLLVAFGFAAENPAATIAGQPEVARLYDLMEQESIPPEIKHIVKAQLALIAASMEMWI